MLPRTLRGCFRGTWKYLKSNGAVKRVNSVSCDWFFFKPHCDFGSDLKLTCEELLCNKGFVEDLLSHPSAHTIAYTIVIFDTGHSFMVTWYLSKHISLSISRKHIASSVLELGVFWSCLLIGYWVLIGSRALGRGEGSTCKSKFRPISFTESFTKPMCLLVSTKSWCWPKGTWALGTRLISAQINPRRVVDFSCDILKILGVRISLCGPSVSRQITYLFFSCGM